MIPRRNWKPWLCTIGRSKQSALYGLSYPTLSLARQGQVGEDPGNEVEEKRPTISRHRFSSKTGESIFCLRTFAVHGYSELAGVPLRYV